MKIARLYLVKVLRDARTLLALPDNEFGYSPWETAEDAVREIDGIIATVQLGGKLNKEAIDFLFLPTGPIQEVSVSSGWGKQFLTLARRFDVAIALA